MPQSSTPRSCALHPGSLIRPLRTDGPLGRAVYLHCVPLDGEPHLLDPPSTSRVAMTVRAEDGGTRRIASYAGDVSLPFGLTQTELTVLQAAARGLTVPETARHLKKGSETVKTQRNRIILKIGARNITHAVCIAAEHGLVSAAA